MSVLFYNAYLAIRYSVNIAFFFKHINIPFLWSTWALLLWLPMRFLSPEFKKLSSATSLKNTLNNKCYKRITLGETKSVCSILNIQLILFNINTINTLGTAQNLRSEFNLIRLNKTSSCLSLIKSLEITLT